MDNNAYIQDKYKGYQKEVEEEQSLSEPNNEFIDLLEIIDKVNVE